MVISIIGATLTGNKGAEAMLQTTVYELEKRFPGAYFNIFSYYPKKDKLVLSSSDCQILDASPFSLVFKIFPAALLASALLRLRLNVPSFLTNQETRALVNSNLLIDIGGISFSDGREKFLPFNVLCIWPAILLKKQVFKLSQALGPFNGFINRKVAKWILPKCSHVFARGERTLSYAEGLYGNKNVSYAADIAFLYEGTQKLTTTHTETNDEPVAGDKKTVGICPSAVIYPKVANYSQIYADFARELIAKDYRVLFIPNAIRPASEKLRNNDLVVIREIADLLEGREGFELIDKDIGAAGIKAAIDECDYFVTSRFHSMIAALSLEVPVVVCGWGHKYFEVLERFDLLDFVFDYKNLSVSLLNQKFNFLIENESNYRQLVKGRLPEVKAEAKRQFDTLINPS